MVAGHARRSQDIPVATTSRDTNAGHVQHQATGATTDHKLSRTELNVIKTMITVIVCFLIFWSVPVISNFFEFHGVGIRSSIQRHNNHIITASIPGP